MFSTSFRNRRVNLAGRLSLDHFRTSVHMTKVLSFADFTYVVGEMQINFSKAPLRCALSST